MILISLVMIFITVIYLHHKWNFGYWRRRKVPGPAPWPIVGNMLDVLLMKKTFIELVQDVYNQYPDVPYIGFYRFLTPLVIIRDINLGKKILVQDFASFMDTDMNASKDEHLVQKNIFMMKGEEWKKTREKVAPLLSSGKIRQVFPLLHETCENLAKYIKKSEESQTEGLETRELCNKFTTDVVASCAFGLDAKALTEPHSVFREMGRKIFEPTTINAIKIALVTMVPVVNKLITVNFIPPVVSEWIIKVVTDTVQYRRDNKIKRDDFLQSLIQLHDQSDGKDFTMIDVAAQCTSFLLDGFETSGSVNCLALYELACHPEIQEKVLQESNEVLKRHDGKLSYDAMIEMTYTDAILNESMRKWPLIGGLPRQCTKEYELPAFGPFGPRRGHTVCPGDSVLVAVGAYCKDPDYFPDPEKFDPTRFLDGTANKEAFYPWGAGPRLCIGQRFALLQAKGCIISIVRNFKLSVSKKMSPNPKLDPRSFIPRLQDGTWIIYTPRN